jgi:CHAT domain-containing protein
MKCFYSQLVSGASKSAALQAAQLSFLHNPTDHSDHTMSVEPTYLTHPYFWASFFLVGVTGTL